MSAPAQAPRVVIAGGGVAALEAVLALRSVIDQQVTIELLSPQERFTYRPLTVLEPFAGQEAWSFELERFAADQDVRYRQDGLAEVDARGHVALTQGGEELPYSALLLATGTRMHEWLPGALTFGTPGSSEAVRELVEDLELGTVQRVAYAVPPREGWMLPVYELALLTATHLAERGIADRELTLVTPEDEPLAAFGQRASIAVRTLLEQHGIALRTDRYPTAFDAGTLHLVPDGELAVERVVTLPRLEGVPIPGVPHDPEGFVHIDEHGAVDGLQDVYAAGDMTTFPIKQGGIATQMADAAAEAILAQLGLPIEPRPFRPVLQGVVVTGGSPTYLRADLRAGGGSEPRGYSLWWPPSKIAGRFLSPYLQTWGGAPRMPEVRPGTDVIPVEVDVRRLIEPS